MSKLEQVMAQKIAELRIVQPLVAQALDSRLWFGRFQITHGDRMFKTIVFACGATERICKMEIHSAIRRAHDFYQGYTFKPVAKISIKEFL